MRSLLFLLSMCAASTAAADVIDVDRARIQEHLARVETELRARDTGDMEPVARLRREMNLDRLHDYWTAGEFPHNTRAGRPTPIFVDEEGRACAMAYLLLESGAIDAVGRVVARENLEHIVDMREPGLGPWLEANGLTLEEAALIQPYYDPIECCEDDGRPVCVQDTTVDGDIVQTTFASRCVAEQECGGRTVAYEGECVGPNVDEEVVDHCCSEGGCSIGGAPAPSPVWFLGLAMAIALRLRSVSKSRSPRT